MFAASETPTGPTQELSAPSDDLRSADLGVRIGMQRSADSIDKNGYRREREITMQTQSATPASLQACAARAFGIAIGNLFLGGFGMVWIVLGHTAAERINPLLLALLSVFLAALIISSVYIMRRTHGLLDRQPRQSDRAKENQPPIRSGEFPSVELDLRGCVRSISVGTCPMDCACHRFDRRHSFLSAGEIV